MSHHSVLVTNNQAGAINNQTGAINNQAPLDVICASRTARGEGIENKAINSAVVASMCWGQ